MKRIYLIIILLSISLSGLYINAQSITAKAEAAYAKDNFIEALKLYLEAEKKEGVSSQLYYNIGNSYYRLGNKGKAILYYERSLNLNPRNEEARQNLEFVNSKIVDKTNVNEMNIIAKIFFDIRDTMSSNGWAALAITLFILFISAVALYIFSTSVIAKKIGFFGGIPLLILVVIVNYYSYSSRDRVLKRNYAIVTSSSVTLGTSPRIPKDRNEEAFILNEGTKIFILDSVDTTIGGKKERWYDVKADDTHRAWINKDKIEII